MSSLTKSFKKMTKKVTKTAKKATNAVKDAGETAVGATAGAANAAAHQITGTAEDVARRTVKITQDAGQIAENSYEQALAAGESAWNEVASQVERWLTDGMNEILIAAAKDVYKRNRALVSAMANAGAALTASPAMAPHLNIVIDSAARKKRDKRSDDSMKVLGTSPELRPVNKEAKGYGSISIGTGGSAAYGAGAEGCFGMAYDIPQVATVGGFFGVGGVVGSFGASMTIQLGAWTVMPAKLAGPYLAVGLELEVEFGGGFQVIFSLPTTESDWLALASGKTPPMLCGIVVFVGGGGEASAAVSGGYTWVF